MKIHTTSYIQISRKALENNLAFLRAQMGPSVRISSVVKGNAYGHGIEPFVPLAEACGVNHFSVFEANEAYLVKQALQQPETEVMVMGMINNDELAWAIENGVSFYVFEMDRMKQALKAAQRVGKAARIHLELETGMNRTGFCEQGWQEAARLLRENTEHLRFEGLCTHFAGAESIANYVRVTRQRKNFNRIAKWFRSQQFTPSLYHTACSAAAIRYPPTRMDMVRIGILQYGFWPSREIFIEYSSQLDNKRDPLQRLISWSSKIMDVKSVKAGEYIGYGNSYLANENLRIATVPVGYAHGFSRSLSNQGRALVHGRRVAVIGMVNMNMVTIDVTGLEQAAKGDEVTFIGFQGDMELSVSSFGEFSHQVNYELLTRLPANIPRMVVE
ncbi:MAG: alanine racemase [Phaeodactylibacter sp.]|nr:alanine racemase [Phaeodactylibacter sp.]HQU58667.1 alanine racemase [Saprospiraceae bacterium]